MDRSQLRTLITRYAVGLAVGALFAALWALLQSAGFGLAWLVFLPALVVLYFLGEWAFEPLFSAETGAAISQSKFSVLRIGIALLLVLPFFGVIIAIGWAVRGSAPL